MPKNIFPAADHAVFSDREFVFMLGEELKKPLTAIQALAQTGAAGSTINLEARKALRTIDNVLLYQKLMTDQLSLEIAPVHVGSTLTQIATSMRPLSLEFGCETEVNIQAGLSAVDVDARVLRSGLESLWQAVLGMSSKPSPMSWHVYRQPNGIRVMLVNNSLDISKVSFARSATFGNSRQPFAGVAGPVTDLIAARGLFDGLGAKLTKTRRDGADGFAVTLNASPQLAMFGSL